MADDRSIKSSNALPGCPLDPVLNLLAQKWLVHIVWYLGNNASLRFAELRRQLPGVSAKVLSTRLKQLEALGIVERRDKRTSLPHVDYRLTSCGRSINGLLESLELNARNLALPAASLEFKEGAEPEATRGL